MLTVKQIEHNRLAATRIISNGGLRGTDKPFVFNHLGKKVYWNQVRVFETSTEEHVFLTDLSLLILKTGHAVHVNTRRPNGQLMVKHPPHARVPKRKQQRSGINEDCTCNPEKTEQGVSGTVLSELSPSTYPCITPWRWAVPAVFMVTAAVVCAMT
jgi:hypothetical protein